MKFVIEPLDKKTAREIGAKGTTAVKQRITTREGDSADVWVLEVTSDSFEDDMTYVFGRNVAKARRENKRLTGSLDGIVDPR